MNDFVLTESGGTLNLLDVYNVGVEVDTNGLAFIRVVTKGNDTKAVRVASYTTWEEACCNAHELSMRAQRAQGRIK